MPELISGSGMAALYIKIETIVITNYTLHNLWFTWTVIKVHICLCNAVKNIKAFCKLTEGSVLSVKMRSILMHDKEL